MYKIEKTRNKLTMISSPMPHMSSVSIGVWVAAGGRYEQKDQNGISHFLEHMLFKGTETRTAKQLKQAIEGIGGRFNGFTSDELTCYLVKLPGKFLDLGIEILCDMVLNAKLDEGEIRKEKQVISEEIKMYRDNPSDHVMEMLEATMWPGCALGRPLTGTLKTLKSMGKRELLEYKEKMYNPGNVVVVASGKFSENRFFEITESMFSERKPGRASSFERVEVNQTKPRVSISKRKTKQTHMAMGFPVKKLPEKKRLAVKLMSIILGGNMSSRLFEELREKYGLCYDVSSSFKRNKDVGHFNIHAGVDSRNLMRSVIAIVEELRKLKDLKVTSGELERAKKYARGNFALAMEATSSRMLWLGDRYMVDGKIPSVEEVMNAVEEVNLRDIRRVSTEIFSPLSGNIAVVGDVNRGDREKLKKRMGKL